MIAAAIVVGLDPNRGFVHLDVMALHQLPLHRAGHRDQQLAYPQDGPLGHAGAAY